MLQLSVSAVDQQWRLTRFLFCQVVHLKGGYKVLWIVQVPWLIARSINIRGIVPCSTYVLHALWLQIYEWNTVRNSVNISCSSPYIINNLWCTEDHGKDFLSQNTQYISWNKLFYQSYSNKPDLGLSSILPNKTVKNGLGVQMSATRAVLSKEVWRFEHWRQKRWFNCS